MGDTLEYPDVLQEIRGAMNPGRLKLQSGSFIFKNIKTGIVDTVHSSDIEKCTWLMRARGYCLKILLSTGVVHRFDGFRETEYEKLSDFVHRNYEKPLRKKDMSVKGWNWGTANFIGNSLDFDVDRSHLFEIPLGNVSHSVTAKNEVTLEFHQNDDAAVSLSEIRFHIPSGDNPEKDNVEEFYQNVISKADIIQATGDAIANFAEVQCLTPRGRYDIKIYQTFMQLHGKTFDYKIPYTTILRLFLLPHKDNRQMFFVVSVDPPIKQGQTRYHFLIILFNKEDETTLELALSEKEIEEKYEGKLTQSMQGPEYEIISRVMKTLVNRKITVPGTFIGHSGVQSVSCSYKAATGFLYPLERGFIFVHKPPVHIRFDEVNNVNFARSSGSNRSFDFEVETKTGTVFTFVSIEKEEYAKLYDFVKNKKLRVKNIRDKMDKKGTSYDDMMESDEEGHDAYLERMKAEGQQRNEDENDEDEDSSEDLDFDPDANEIFKEPDEEFDTDFESSNSDESGSGSGSSTYKPKEKKERKPRTKTVREGRTKKKGKRKKDPNAPKRPQTAYFIWLNEHREEIKTKYPGISVTDLSKKAGEMWREITDKKEWEDKNVIERAAYEVAIEKYRQEQKDNPPSSADEEEDNKTKKKRSQKISKISGASPVKETTSGTGMNFKSREFISDESSSEAISDSDDSDKPLKQTPPKKKKSKKATREDTSPDKTPEKRKAKKSETEESSPEKTPRKKKAKNEESSPEKTPEKIKRSRRQGNESASEPEELPTEESDAALTDGGEISSAVSDSD